MPPPHVAVIGGGLAGLAASIALADCGVHVSLLEKQPRLGGRATSYLLPSGESIDNCQHVTLRCCTNLEDLYRRIGVSNKIRYYDRLAFAGANGDRAFIEPSRLPAPFHLFPSFAAFRLLNARDKFVIARALFRIVRAGGRPVFADGTTMLAWLRDQKQTKTAIDHFWRVILVSALNEELDRTDAAYGIAVLWKAFLSNSTAFGIGIPVVPLSDLYAPAFERINRSGGTARTKCGVAELRICNSDIVGMRQDSGSELTADYYIAAIPFDRLLKVLPPDVRMKSPFGDLTKFHGSPITGIHLWFDRTVMSEPFLTSLDHTIQWIFNKTALLAQTPAQAGQYLQVVISASHTLSERSQQDITDLCRRELGLLLPATAEAKLTRAVVIRENAATFSPVPGVDAWRPGAGTPIRNLFLAGDWVQTGWPATMESAVRSGYQAAEMVLALAGRPARIVQPELQVSALARWLSRP